MEEEAKKLIIVALALLGIVAFGVGVAVWQTNAADDVDDVGNEDGAGATSHSTVGIMNLSIGMDSFLLYFICTQNDKIGARFGGAPQSRDGQQFPVAREDLYPNYAARDRHLDQLLETDYVSSFIIGTLPKNCQHFQGCRYSQSSRDCYCCGAFFHYTEQVVHAKPKQTLLSRCSKNPVAIW